MSTTVASDNNAHYFQALIPGTTQMLSFTNTAADSLAFGASTTLVTFFATKDCWIRIKPSSSTATAAALSSGVSGPSFFLPGGIVRFFGLGATGLGPYKVSVVRDSASGSIYMTEAA